MPEENLNDAQLRERALVTMRAMAAEVTEGLDEEDEFVKFAVAAVERVDSEWPAHCRKHGESESGYLVLVTELANAVTESLKVLYT